MSTSEDPRLIPTDDDRRHLREIRSARIDNIQLTVELADGCAVTVPLTFYPTLLLASAEDRAAMEVSPYSLHWEALDCDLGIEGLLQGCKEHPALAARAQKKFHAQKSNAAA